LETLERSKKARNFLANLLTTSSIMGNYMNTPSRCCDNGIVVQGSNRNVAKLKSKRKQIKKSKKVNRR